MKKTIMLKKNYEFRNVLSKGKGFSGKFITVFVLKNDNQDINFLGLAISSKIAKAVRRNRIKRLIKESYYFFEEHMKKGNSIVFLWNKHANIKKIYFFDIKEDMENVLKKAQIL